MNLIRAFDNGSIKGTHAAWPFSSWRLLLLFTLVILLASCNTKKYLSEDQTFLFENKIRIKSDDKVDNAAELKEKLSLLYRQKRTRTVIGIPRHVFYYQYIERLRKDSLENRPAKTKDEDWLNKNRPVIYDSTETVKTTEDFENYLRLRGYRTPEVTFNAVSPKPVSKVLGIFKVSDDRKTYVTYYVDPGPRMYLDTFSIMATDTALQRLADETQDETFFKEGSPLDIELYNKEQTRIVHELQNEGYATFDETFISPMEVDTSGGRVYGIMRLMDQPDSMQHKQYYVGDVTIYPDYDQSDTSDLHEIIVGNVTYISPEPTLSLKPEAIERNIFLHEGDLTRIDNVTQTLRNLSRMELVRFVTRDPKIDTTSIDTNVIDYTLYLTRNSKIHFGWSGELTYSSIALQNRSLFGVSTSLSYRDLNIFNGAETFGINGEFGREFESKLDVSEKGFGYSYNAGIGSTLTIPRLMDPLGLYRLIGSSKYDDQPALIKSKIRKWLIYDATTGLNLNWNQVRIRALYQYYTVNAGLSYLIKPNSNTNLVINRMGIDLYVPTPTDSFQNTVLNNSVFQAQSFGKYLFTGLIYRGHVFTDESPSKSKGGVLKVNHNTELSGLEVWAINKFTDAEFVIGKDDPETSQSELIRFSHFVKGEVDARYLYNINSATQLGFKFNLGVAVPFGYSQQVPYIKQFFVGGALSNRGWQVRELGPGGYHDFHADTTDFAYYQTGDIKIDLSAELRFPLFWYFDGAVFIDAGNVWTHKFDPGRPNAEFSTKRFLNEMGISYGFGMRMDLDFFILRADLGYRLRSPYPLEETGSHWYKQRFPAGYVDGNTGENRAPELQIGIGLPFD